MSYDFAVLTPEAAGLDDRAAVAAAVAVFEGENVAGRQADPRLTSFLDQLEAEGAANEDDGWISVWPLDVSADGLAVPTTYGNVDNNVVVLLRMAARHGLVLVDLNAGKVNRPAAGEPVGVKAGDGTRLGALTYERLASLVSGLPSSDPWIILERGPQVFVQTLRQENGTFMLEHRDGGPDLHFTTSLSEAHEVVARMWAWIEGDRDWNANADWEQVQF